VTDDETRSPIIVYLSLGSNLGDRLENLRRAFRLLGEKGIALRRTSSVYETEPVDNTDQGWFLNCVAEIGTSLEALGLLRRLQRIENELGRERLVRRGPRTLDIDMLLYGDLVLESSELTLPHPRMLERRFVLEPLRELGPHLVIPGVDGPGAGGPGTGRTVEQAYAGLRDTAQVRLLLNTLCA
jgi:2-amino-4-hydroxy-6-hydroxymethyldihydropteridine diphosphokinase